jgi:hypothetical protein
MIGLANEGSFQSGFYVGREEAELKKLNVPLKIWAGMGSMGAHGSRDLFQ